MLKPITMLTLLIAGMTPALATDIGYDIGSDIDLTSLDVFDRTTRFEANDATPRYCPKTSINIAGLADTSFDKEIANQLLNSYDKAQQEIREKNSVIRQDAGQR